MQYLKAKLASKMWLWLAISVTALLALAWFYGPDIAQAAPPPTTPPTTPPAGGGDADQLGNAAYANFLQIVLLLQELLNKILWPILFMIGGLMDNDLIFNHGMETRLFAIWVQIRNIVNILFVIALVGLALYNVLGIGGEGDQFSLKAVLPKLIVGIIAVNFSYIGIKILLDAINLGTTAIFSLPEAVEEGLSVNYKDANEKDLYQKVVCENLYGTGGLDPKSPKVEKILKEKNISASDITLESTKNPFICVGVKLNQSAQKYFERFGVKNAAMVLAVNMGKIAFFDKAAIESAGSFAKLSLNVLFSLVLYFIYVCSFLALFAILIARLVVIWLGVALSPFLMLSTALPGGLKEKLSVIEKIKFVKHAFVPLEIAFPMSVGFMMLQAFQGISFAGGDDFSASMLTTGTLNIGVATSGLSTLQDLLIAVATIGVVWKGVFDAAEGTLAEKVVGTIREAGESLGGFVASAPFKYIPWVPVTTGTAGKVDLTPAALMETLKEVPGNFEQAQREKARKALGAIGLNTGGGSNPLLFDRITAGDDAGFKNALGQNFQQLQNKDVTTGEKLQGFVRNSANKATLDKIRDKHPESKEWLDKIANPETKPADAAYAGYELARKLKIEGPTTAPTTPTTPGAEPGAAATGAARMKDIVKKAGSPEKLEEAVKELPSELKAYGEKVAAAEKANNVTELEELAKDPKALELEVSIDSDTKSALGYAATMQTDEAGQIEIARRITTARAKFGSNPAAAEAAEKVILAKVEATLGDNPEKATILNKIKENVKAPQGEDRGPDEES